MLLEADKELTYARSPRRVRHKQSRAKSNHVMWPDGGRDSIYQTAQWTIALGQLMTVSRQDAF